jgi:hypothetical protein
MTTERRISAIEGALTPTELIVAWLTEAHAHGGVDALVRSTLEEEAYVPPINRLGHAAADGARARMKGKPRDEINRAVDQAVRETLFRFHLVMRINVITHDILERKILLTALLSCRIALLTREPRASREKDPGHRADVEQLRDLVVLSVRSFKEVGAAREQVERRYFGGHAAPFPDDAARWEEQLETNEAVERMAIRLVELDGVPPAAAPDSEATGALVAAHVADLVEPAKVIALEQLDEGRQALGIATSWLRGKLDQ